MNNELEKMVIGRIKKKMKKENKIDEMTKNTTGMFLKQPWGIIKKGQNGV